MLKMGSNKMIKLYGFSASNYYNVPKLALLEKGIPFEEALTYIFAGAQYKPEYLDISPLGKIPTLETEQGAISESRAIVEYIERAYPDNALLPSNAFDIAKVHEIAQYVEIYFELVARRLIPNLLTGKAPDALIIKEVRNNLNKAALGLAKLSTFEEYAYGNQFTLADISVILHLPIVRLVGKTFLGGDVLEKVPGLTDYCLRMEERSAVIKVREDAENDRPHFMAHVKALL
jgi:glutathione S-transferase